MPREMTFRRFACSLTVLLLLALWMPHAAAHPQSAPKPPATSAKPAADSPIHFAFQPIDFQLDSERNLERHAPETMAGGVAVFDYNNDGKLDIFFTNGADIKTLQKTSAKYSNRLFENDGHGHFTDVTEKAGLTGTGYDTGVAIGGLRQRRLRRSFCCRRVSQHASTTA